MGSARFLVRGSAALIIRLLPLSITTGVPKDEALVFRGVSKCSGKEARGYADILVERS